ncbi:MAG: ABC transporter substrate-binding protein [Alphaproteobacteria bacterium]|jgi:phospholipid transport system substrate-binding protein|nr:ABC transporter substrate-binding protein [Alphaproteobacteria bacterium]MDP7172548.1 ABC transporter substrate-binding protein [Alphaproteobacteria bacterium]
MISRRSLTRIATLVPFAIALGGRPGPSSASPDGAAHFIEGLIDEAIAVLRIPVEERVSRESQFRTLLRDKFDVPLITRLVVGRHWRRATDAQKQAFMLVFEEHIVKIYTSQLGVYNEEIVAIRNVASRTERDTIVGTEVMRSSDAPLQLDWLVREEAGAYRVIDIAAEGVSLMTTKRSEFSSVIQRDGLDGLIEKLRVLNADQLENS